MKSSSLENSIYDNNSNNSLLQQPNMLVTPYAKEDRTTTSMINSPTSSSNDENEEFNNENSNIYYPATNALPSTQKKSSKRRSQVRNACVNCQKACKKCDEGRPCQRCIKLGITDTCVDSPRKERKKGFKRGPYRKRSVTTQPHIIPKRDISAATTTTPLFTTSIPIHKEENVNAIDLSNNSQSKSWSTLSSPLYNDPINIGTYNNQPQIIKRNSLEYYNLPADNIMYNSFQPRQQHNNRNSFITNNRNDNNNYINALISPIESYKTPITSVPYVHHNQLQQQQGNISINQSYQTHQNNNSITQFDHYYSQVNNAMVSSPEDTMVNSVPGWTYTDSFEYQLYNNTQTTSHLVPKLDDNSVTMITPNNKQQQYYQHQHYIPSNTDHHGDYTIVANRHPSSIYHVNQEWMANPAPSDIYYYPTDTRYSNDYY